MKTIILIFSLSISACSNLPKTITNAPIKDIQLAEVSGKTSNFSGTLVRWGGIIVSVDNEEDSTGIQVLSYPLGSYGRPQTHRHETGRFYVKINEFLDPEAYVKGSEITVAGVIKGVTDKQIGKKTLTLPVVDSQNLHLWRRYQYARYNNSNYWPYGYGFYTYRGYHPFGRFGYRSNYGYRSRYGYRACY